MVHARIASSLVLTTLKLAAGVQVRALSTQNEIEATGPAFAVSLAAVERVWQPTQSSERHPSATAATQP
jgi:hypothetical protein